MLWYIMVCSMIGGISVSVTTGLGSAIVTSALGDNQVCASSVELEPSRLTDPRDSSNIGSLISSWLSSQSLWVRRW